MQTDHPKRKPSFNGAADLLPFNPDEKYYSFDQLALLSALADVERMAAEAERRMVPGAER